MEDSLQETRYCDHGHRAIRALAVRLREACDGPAYFAQRAFAFVRDELPFGFDVCQRRASETLERGHGVCWNKAVLLIAILRCNRIPARLGSIPLRRTFIVPAIGAWHRLANDPFHHCFVHALLEGRWTMLDPTLDRRSHEAFFVPSGAQWGIDWDGHADMHLYTDSVAGAPVIHPDLDAALDRKMGNTELPRLLASVGNSFMNRRMWRRVAVRAAASDVAADAADRSHRSCAR